MYFVVKMPFTHSNFIDYRTSRVRRRTTYLRLDPQNWPDSPPGPSQRPKRNPQRSPQSWPGLSIGQIGRETRLIPLFTSTKNTNRYKWCWLKVERERGELDKFVLKFNFFFIFRLRGMFRWSMVVNGIIEVCVTPLDCFKMCWRFPVLFLLANWTRHNLLILIA